MSTKRLLALHCAFTLTLGAIIWLLPFSSFGDYFQHLVRMYIRLNYENLEFTKKYYDVHFQLAPYIGMDAFFYAFKNLLSVYEVGRLVNAISVVLICSSVVFLNYQTQRLVTIHSFLVYPFIFTMILGYGWINYYLSIGFALWGFGLWLYFEQKPKLRFWFFLIYSLVAFFTHLFGLMAMMLIISVYELQKNNFSILRSPRRIFQTVLIFFAFNIIPLYITLFIAEPQDSGMSRFSLYGTFADLVIAIFSPAYYNFSYLNVTFYILFLTLFILRVVRVGKFPFLILILVFFALLLPKYLYGLVFINLRLPIVIVFLTIALMQTSKRKLDFRFLIVLTLVTGFLSMGLNIQKSEQCSVMANEFKDASKKLPIGSRLLTVKTETLAIPPCTLAPGFDSLAVLATMENQIYVPIVYSGFWPIKVKPEYKNLSIMLGAPITLSELKLQGKDYNDYEAKLLAYPYVSHEFYWKNWRQDFDYVMITHYENHNFQTPNELEPAIKGSFFTIYKIKKIYTSA